MEMRVVLAVMVVGCVAGCGGKTERDVGRVQYSWSLDDATWPLDVACELGETVRVSVDAVGVVDEFDCADGMGLSSELPGERFSFRYELIDAEGGVLASEGMQITVWPGNEGVVALPVTFTIPSGQVPFSWVVLGETGERACYADESVAFHFVEADILDITLPCGPGAAIVSGVPRGSHQVEATLRLGLTPETTESATVWVPSDGAAENVDLVFMP
jgi:hypothetical protein